MLLVRRGLSALGTRISNVTIAQGDFLVLGLFAAKPVVGAYFFAFRLSSQPMTILSGSVTSVLFSSLLKIGDRARRAQIAFYAAEMITAVTLPLCLLMAVVAGPVMWALFGEKWRLATPLVQILSIGMPFDVVSWPAAALLVANGEFKRSFFYQSWSVPLVLFLVTLGAVKASAYGVAIGVAVYYVVHSLGYTAATFRRSDVGVPAVIGLFLRLFVCSATAFGPVYLLVTLPELHGQPLAKLVLAITLSPLAYLAALFVFARRIFDNLLAQAAVMLRRYVPGLPLPAALAARSEA
jgi:PST family polysaccharide transporter